MTDNKRKKTGGPWRKPKVGKTFKQFRDETTGRFMSKDEADKQAGAGNVMVHTVERPARALMPGFLRAFFQRGRREQTPVRAPYEDGYVNGRASGYASGFADGVAAERVKQSKRKRNVKNQ